jgi:uncharacterized protein (DUF427 family)
MKLPGPDHPITIEPVNGRVVVRAGDTVIADTAHALELREASYKPVLYIPRGDAKMEHYARTAHSTHCPYKGDASYFDLPGVPNAVWSYETPYPAMAAIKDHLAFYPQHVTIERT